MDSHDLIVEIILRIQSIRNTEIYDELSFNIQISNDFSGIINKIKLPCFHTFSGTRFKEPKAIF